MNRAFKLKVSEIDKYMIVKITKIVNGDIKEYTPAEYVLDLLRQHENSHEDQQTAWKLIDALYALGETDINMKGGSKI